MNTLFVTPGPVKWASTRFRAYWPAQHLGASVVEAKNLTEEHAEKYDTFVFIKVFDYEVIKFLQGSDKRLWYDTCDPTHWFEPKEIRQVLGQFHGISASNPELALDLHEWSGYPVHTIPDRIELEHYPKRKKHNHADTIRFIWYGASQNRMTIFSALANLERLVANGFTIELTIYDDNPTNHWNVTRAFPIYYTQWQLDQENDVIASHDIALISPYPGAWGRVKSNNKSLTAWACGLPATDGQDYAKMTNLVAMSSLRQIEADRGYEELIADYTVEESAAQWETLLNDL